MRSGSEKTKPFFNVFDGRAGPGAAHHKIIVVRPGPGGTILPYTPAHSFARTQARNATATETETEIDFPVGTTPLPPT